MFEGSLEISSILYIKTMSFIRHNFKNFFYTNFWYDFYLKLIFLRNNFFCSLSYFYEKLKKSFVYKDLLKKLYLVRAENLFNLLSWGKLKHTFNLIDLLDIWVSSISSRCLCKTRAPISLQLISDKQFLKFLFCTALGELVS